MKKVRMILSTVFILVVAISAQAQDSDPDYFAGDWKVVLKGTPSGDAEMVMHLERVDGKLTGEMRAEGIDPSKFKTVSEKEAEITVNYMTMGYDINITFKKVDDNNLKGSLMGMFDATGERIVE
ncbi:hypothetical protein [uncultured Draconibacterium sp.]|uniref:hypothetical protein n=1 Tax=uncultured Draconibacterium sp. TaxID=1573823 RepID=UPI002AA8D66E|nr:hypothetical protein [uncultured Draconibacterium sp.]